MSCKHADCEHRKCREEELQAAREAVIEAAKAWFSQNRSVDGISHASELFYRTKALVALEPPPDPLEPVREFVRYFYRNGLTVYGPDNTDVFKMRNAAAKALGMDK